MLKFLFVLLLFFLILLSLLGFSVFRMIKNILFGKESSNTSKGRQRRRTTSSSRQQTNSSRTYQDTTPRKKIIGEDEGEYVDYEEIKETSR